MLNQVRICSRYAHGMLPVCWRYAKSQYLAKIQPKHGFLAPLAAQEGMNFIFGSLFPKISSKCSEFRPGSKDLLNDFLKNFLRKFSKEIF